MKYYVRLQMIIFILIFFSCKSRNPGPARIDFGTGWKFSSGDDSLWAFPNFDDSNWDSITVRQDWEPQGYPTYDGYAWYRRKVVVPSSIKKGNYLQDSILFFLGKIDDCDQFFLNGEFVGQNNKKYESRPPDSVFFKEWAHDVDRKYLLSVNDPRILWDKENVIAVRVLDKGGGGGMYNGIPTVMAVDIGYYFSVNTRIQPYHFNDQKIRNLFKVKNTSGFLEMKGDFRVSVVSEQTKKETILQNERLNLHPQQSVDIRISFQTPREPAIIKFAFKPDDYDNFFTSSDELPYMLTPPSGEIPKINGPKIYGARPGHPFLFTISATGLRPVRFGATGLPAGLSLDEETGIITGKVEKSGNYEVLLRAQNDRGESIGKLLIKIGKQVALTPPMGWNSWNCWGESIDEEKVIQSARAFIENGLQQHGWSYINIDGGWQGVRDECGEMIPNDKFPDMKALGDSLHNMGLKFGIYSSPGPLDCGMKNIGSYQHEMQDANSFASWGVDYLKYDWCTYSEIAKDLSVPELKKPYQIMRDALELTGRDIVYSICQYGMGNVWEWGNEVGGNLWRTTYDITDTWESMYQIGFGQTMNARYAGPGNWNDPDMLIVGMLGWGPELHPTRLKVNEQYTHISLWCLLSAPLLIGCDLSQLDDFTLNLLTNDEVLAIDQDPLGRQAIPVYWEDKIQVWKKELEDGAVAIGIFNTGDTPEKVTIPLYKLGLRGQLLIRDVWRQQDLGKYNNTFKTRVLPHGVTLLKINNI